MSSPWMTFQKSAHCKIKSFERSVFSECFQCILGTCWGEAACWRLEWRDAHLIESDQDDEREDSNLFHGRDDLAASFIGSIAAFHDCHSEQSEESLLS